MIFDSHFHLYTLKEKNLPYSLDNLIGLDVALKSGDIKERIKIRGDNKDIFLSSGSGPWVIEDDDYKGYKKEGEQVRKEIEEYHSDAIGECGLDNYHHYGSVDEQISLFREMSEVAREYNLPLIVHCRDAEDELLGNLDLINEKTIMHCFSLSKEVMFKLLDKGAYISFCGNVTYKGNNKLLECVRECPEDRILYETDSPYLTPNGKRGEPNKMENSEITLSFISNIRKKDKEKLKDKVINNFYTLMGKKESSVNVVNYHTP